MVLAKKKNEREIMGVVFVAGVHAVGKTTVCEQVANECKVAHYSASSLIKAEKQSAIADHGKAVADVSGNQQLLVAAVERIRSQSEQVIILDGHFTLINGSGSIEPLSIELFQQLSLVDVVLFRDSPNMIASRMGERDGELPDPDGIAQHQELEIRHAEQVCRELDIPFHVSEAFDLTALAKAVLRAKIET